MASIRFPKMHIATSVSNRILNIADGLPSIVPAVGTQPPMLPDVGLQGDALNQQLNTPLPATELPGGTDGAVVDAALNGESLVSPALAPGLGL